MNICGNGICVCDNYEYPDTQCSQANKPVFTGVVQAQRYYFDKRLGVVLSVAPEKMEQGITYYRDPDLTQPV